MAVDHERLNGEDLSAGVPSALSPWWRTVLAGLAVIFAVAGLFVFARGLDNGLVSDDWVFLDQAFRAAGPAGMLSASSFGSSHFVRPIQSLITWSLFWTFGVVPLPYHLASLLLHLVNSALLYLLARRLAILVGVAKNLVVWASAGAGLLFFLNWHHHEAVYWFSAINEPLSTLLRLLTLLTALQWLGRSPWRAGLYSLSLVSMCLALFAKESAVAVPLEILLLAWLARRYRPGTWTVGKTLLALVPFGLIVMIWLGFYLSAPGVASGVVIQRSGLQVMQASPIEWLLRSLQYFDAHYLGGTLLGQNITLLALEALILTLLTALAVRRNQYLWVFALAWTLCAALPDVAVVPEEVSRLHLPILAVGVFGDRYLYYSSAGASLTLIASLLWIGQEVQGGARRAWINLAWAAATALVTLTLGLNLDRLAVEEADWGVAGRLGTALVQQAVQGMSGKNGMLCVANLPDNYRGKYVFRNGIGGALDLADPQARYSIRVLPGADSKLPNQACTFFVDGNQIAQSLVNR